MKKIIICLFLSTFSFQLNQAAAEIYYISNSGNDNNNGLSPVFPWKTIAKLNKMMSSIKPGDVVLFERNGYFSGQINLTASGNDNYSLIFSAYGEGKNPVISGAVPVNNWKKYTDNIYEAEVENMVGNLFADGIQMTLARFPNNGYLKIKGSLAKQKTGFLDGDLTQKNGYWNGANLRVRTINWAFEHSVVHNFNNKIITLSRETVYPLLAGWGYYLDNIFSELDHEKEWYYQKSESSVGKLYFYPPSDIDPSGIFIEAGIYDFGFYASGVLTNIVISDLEIRNQTVNGIHFAGISNNIQIRNCTFKGQFECGINIVTKSRNCEIRNCRFYNINGKGINILASVKSSVLNNIIENTGLNPGYGTTNDAFGMSAILVLQCDSSYISGNYINNTGHDGINCIGYANHIEKNIILNSLLLLNDGAAIKSYGKNNTGTVWNNNFINNVPGNLEGTPENEDYIVASGAYLDAYCSNMKVIDNTILNCGMASVYLYNECLNNYIKRNVCYDNNCGIIFLKEETPMNGNTVKENIFYVTGEDQLAVKLKAKKTAFIPGVFENNYYCSPVNKKLFSFETGGVQIDFDYFKWNNLMKGSDLNSVVFTGNEALYPKLFTNMSDESLKVVLKPGYNYRDIDQNNLAGSVTLPPNTSRILFTDKVMSLIPEITIAGGPLNFGNAKERRTSFPYWYFIKGENLTEPVTVTSPDGFTVSLKEDEFFGNLLTLNPVNGVVEKIIFVRFDPDEEKDYYDLIINRSGIAEGSVKVIGNSR